MRLVRPMLMVAAFVALLVWPLVLNRAPIVFSDTTQYLAAGRTAWATLGKAAAKLVPHAAAPGGVAAAAPPPPNPDGTISGRSPYYGIFAWAARSFDPLSGIPLAQLVWIAVALRLALPRLGLVGARAQLATVAALSVLTSLGVFAALIMPDVFTGLALLAVALLWTSRAIMGRGEAAFWWITLLAGLVFHFAVVIVGGLLLALVFAISRLPMRQRLVRAAPFAAVLVAGFAANALAEIAIARSGRTVTPIPFITARLIGDGTAAPVLTELCRSERLATCRFLPDLPLTENEFLWNQSHGLPWVRLAPPERLAIAAEQRRIAGEVLRRLPGMQAARSVRNVLSQLLAPTIVKLQPDRMTVVRMRADPGLADDAAAYTVGRLYRERPSLAPVSMVWQATYLLSAGFATVMLLGRRRWLGGADPRIVATLAILLAAVAVSAVVTGTISGPIGRYASRISWLPMLAAIAIAALLATRRRGYKPEGVLQV